MKKEFMLIAVVLTLAGCSHNDSKKVQGYIEGRYTYIASPVGGILQNLAVHRGDTIKSKQLLFQLDPQPQQAEVHQAQADLASQQASLENLLKGKRAQIIKTYEAQMEQAKAALVLSKQNLARTKDLYEKTFEGKKALDEAVSDYQQKQAELKRASEEINVQKLKARIDEINAAKADVKAAKAKLKQQQWQLSQKTQFAPSQSFVFDTYYYKGEAVPANAPVLSLMTPGNVYALFYLKSAEVAKLKLGEEVTLSCQNCQSTKAKISYIGDRAEYSPPMLYSRETSDRLVYRIEAVPETSKTQFHPGQPVTVHLQ